MIKRVLIRYTEKLDEFLHEEFPYPEGISEVGFIGNGIQGNRNKLIVSLLNIERETSGSLSPVYHNNGDGYSQCVTPLHVNLNFIIAAVFEQRRYAESLSILSGALLFVQSTSSFTCNDTTYTVEVMSPTWHELNNIWANMGGHYYPCVICKLRRLTFDTQQIRRTMSAIQEQQIIL